MTRRKQAKSKKALHSRGLSAADYHRLRRRILAGRIASWVAAESLGLCNPKAGEKPLARPVPSGRVASAAAKRGGNQ